MLKCETRLKLTVHEPGHYGGAQVADIEKRQTAEKEREERKAARDAEIAAAERVKNAEASHRMSILRSQQVSSTGVAGTRFVGYMRPCGNASHQSRNRLSCPV